MKFRLSLVSTAALALTACGSPEQAPEAPATEVAAVVPEATGDPDPAVPQGFVTLAASSDMYEIEAGRLAERMGRSEEVKAFGAMMVKDHTASSDKLKAAMADGSADATLPLAMLPMHRRNVEALREATREDFDGLYAQQQVAAHQEALALLQGQAESGTVASLKAFAAETAPIVEGHLGQARDLPGAGGGE